MCKEIKKLKKKKPSFWKILKNSWITIKNPLKYFDKFQANFQMFFFFLIPKESQFWFKESSRIFKNLEISKNIPCSLAATSRTTNCTQKKQRIGIPSNPIKLTWELQFYAWIEAEMMLSTECQIQIIICWHINNTNEQLNEASYKTW